jgi:hypothetical protein
MSRPLSKLFKIAMAVGVTAGTGALLLPSVAHAETTNFTQQILPLNCVFETVNNGTGTIHYLTPAACGQVVHPMLTPGFNASAKPSDKARANAFGQRAANVHLFQPKASTVTGIDIPIEGQPDQATPSPSETNTNKESQAESSSVQPAKKTWPQRHKKLITVSAAAGSLLIILLIVYVIIL